MRLRYWLVLGVVAQSAAAVGFFGVGCSNSTDSTDTGDGGQDAVAADHHVEDVVSEPEPDVQPGCPDADLLSYDPPDADINDAGATVGTCIACIRAPSPNGCLTYAQACNQDCACKQSVVDFASCVSTGKSLLNCATQSDFQGTTAGQNLGLCVLTGCAQPCGVPRDAGIPDAPAD